MVGLPEVVVPLTVHPWFRALVVEVDLRDCDEICPAYGVSQGDLVMIGRMDVPLCLECACVSRGEDVALRGEDCALLGED